MVLLLKLEAGTYRKRTWIRVLEEENILPPLVATPGCCFRIIALEFLGVDKEGVLYAGINTQSFQIESIERYTTEIITQRNQVAP